MFDDGEERHELWATGTDDFAGPTTGPKLAPTADASCKPLTLIETRPQSGEKAKNENNPSKTRGLRAADNDCDPLSQVHPRGLEPLTFGSIVR